jgi:hypothetical protein
MNTKIIDAVQLMRSIRDQIVEEIKDMSIDERMQWLKQSQPKDPLLAKLSRRTAAAGRAERRR